MAPPPPARLDGWKAIAEYLGRDARTLQRWRVERGRAGPSSRSTPKTTRSGRLRRLSSRRRHPTLALIPDSTQAFPVDLDADGRREVIALVWLQTRQALELGETYALSTNGTTLWSFVFTRPGGRLYTWSLAMTNSRGFFSEGGQTAEQTSFAPNRRNLEAEWGPAQFDVRHSLTVAGVADLPFGRGRRFSPARRDG